MSRSSVFIELLLPGSIDVSWRAGIRLGEEMVDVAHIQTCIRVRLVHSALNGAIRNIAGGDMENTPLYAKAIDAMKTKHHAAPSTILDLLDARAAGMNSYSVLSDIRNLLELPRPPSLAYSANPQEPKL